MSPDEEWLLKAVEEVLDTRLLQQWLPGYEPDLTKKPNKGRTNSKEPSKKHARKKALGQQPNRRKR